MNYLDENFNPQSAFWSALWVSNHCPECNYSLNGHTMLGSLISCPVHVKCNKCSAEWSIAIPLGECRERNRITKLLEAEKRFYELRDELRETVNLLRGKSQEKAK